MDEIIPGLYQGSLYEFPNGAAIDVVVDLTGSHQPKREGRLTVAWPIVDGPMPDERVARALGQWVGQLVDRGLSVAVLCAAGVNRSGMITARALISLGYRPQDAIERVRARRLGALSNQDFVEWLLGERPPAHE